MSDLMIVADAAVQHYPNLEFARKLYLFENSIVSNVAREKLQQEIVEEIESNKMVDLYRQLAAKYDWKIDEGKLAQFEADNKASEDAIKQKMNEAIEMGGDMELLDVLFEKSRFFTKIGKWSEALQVLDEARAKPKASTGKRIDALMDKARIAFFHLNVPQLQECIGEAKKLADIGGDWDRRNRLKVYEALTMLITRDLKQSASLFIDGISTFSCVELCSYDQFIYYAVLICIISLPRTELYKKIIANPQIIAAIRTQPQLQTFLQSIYRCDYKSFFESFTFVYGSILEDRYLNRHIRFLMKEYRILAYSQFLEAYKSVRMTSMADSFGISLSLLDNELSHFIAVGRLTARLDKVSGVAVSSRADTKNAQYQDTIKKGDHLLNQIQKLVRVIDV